MDGWENLNSIILYEREKVKRERSIAEDVFLQGYDCALKSGSTMTRGQIAAIAEKYMKENPQAWHYPMAGSVLNCGRRSV